LFYFFCGHFTKNRRAALYVDLGSQPSRSCIWLAKLLKAPVDLKVLRLDKGDTRTKEYKAAIHPLGKVPGFTKTDGKPLIESSAILLHMCENFGGNERFYPQNQRDSINEYLFYHSEFRSGCATYFFTKYMKAVIGGKAAPEAAILKAQKNLFKVLDVFEGFWLKGNYICGNQMTVADIQAVHELNQITVFEPEIVDNYPKTLQWLNRMSQIEYYDETMAGWMKVSNLLKKAHSKL
jgi:glutathione S-transferase